jgi:acetyl esterase/lipase
MALYIRKDFAESVASRSALALKRAPTDVVAIIDERYDSHRDALLDVYVPAMAARHGRQLPTIVWTHGGAWVGGSKEEIGGYLRLLADAGFTVVGVRYSLAPEERYPMPLRQLFAALHHLQTHADRLHVDPHRFLLAGDSAGAQISAQLAAAVTNPIYAGKIGLAPTITENQLCGIALCCGIYDLTGLAATPPFEDFFTTVGWAYSGRRDYNNDPHFISTMSVANHVTEKYPPTFLTAGNDDPLATQSAALASILRKKGVEVETLFYPLEHHPKLAHEYQFDITLDDARIALRQVVAFFRRCTERQQRLARLA